MSDAELFVKRLTRNELGLTGARTHGEIYIPQNCLSFFPKLDESERPQCSFEVYHLVSGQVREFTAFVTQYPRKEAHLRRMKPLLGPDVQLGDFLLLRRQGHSKFEASIIKRDTLAWQAVDSLRGSDAGMVLDKDLVHLLSNAGHGELQAISGKLENLADEQEPLSSVIAVHTVSQHPLTEGMPPGWASEWGQDEFGPWCNIDVDGIQQRLRWIPAGQFQMGVAEEYKGLFDEDGPQHWVTLTRGFWMFETKCSLKLFNAVMKESILPVAADDISTGNLPYWNARAFCGQLSDVLGGVAVKLPTDAQWEFACRAGRQDSDIERNSSDAESPPNPWGLRDMLSGVGELCWDGDREYTAEPVIDPVGNGGNVSVRGLARVIPNWAFRARAFRSRTLQTAMPHGRQTHPSFRETVAVDVAVKDAGFRCVIPQDDWIPSETPRPSGTTKQPATVDVTENDFGETSEVKLDDTPLSVLLRDMESHLHRYYSDLIELPPGVETRWRLVDGNPLCEAGRKVAGAVLDFGLDSKGHRNLPGRGGRLWYMLLRTSRRAKFEDARPFLIAAAKDLAVWLNDHYPNELPHTFVVGDIPLPLRIDNLRTILTVRDLSAGQRVGTGTGWPADQHPLLHAAVEVLVAIPDAITAPDGTPNFPGVGSALWPQLKNLVMTPDDSPTRSRQRSEVAQQFRDWLTNQYSTDSLGVTGASSAATADKTSLNNFAVSGTADPEFDVYLSHNHEDKPAVEPLANQLRSRGLRVMVETEIPSTTTDLDYLLQDAIHRSRCIVLCAASHGLGRWQRADLETYMRGLPDEESMLLFELIIPVLLPGAPRSLDSESDWNTKRWMDFRSGLGKDEIDQLVDVIQEKIRIRLKT